MYDIMTTYGISHTPRQLLEGGHHFDDIGGITGRYNRQQRYNYICENKGVA